MLIDPTLKKINASVDAPKKVLKQKKTNQWINSPAIICTALGAVGGVVYYLKKHNIKIIEKDGKYVILKHVFKEAVNETTLQNPIKKDLEIKFLLLILLAVPTVITIGFYGHRKFTKKQVIHLDMDYFQFLKKPDAAPVTAAPEVITSSKTVSPQVTGTPKEFEGDPLEELDHGVLTQ